MRSPTDSALCPNYISNPYFVKNFLRLLTSTHLYIALLLLLLALLDSKVLFFVSWFECERLKFPPHKNDIKIR